MDSISLRLQHISSRAPNVPRESVGEQNPPALKWIHTDSWWKNMKIIFSPRQELHFQTLLQILRECLQNTFKSLCWENNSHLLDTKPRDSSEVLLHIIILISISFLYSRGNNSLPYFPVPLSWSSCFSPFCGLSFSEFLKQLRRMWTIFLNPILLLPWQNWKKASVQVSFYFSHNHITCSNETFLAALISLKSLEGVD